MIAVFLGPPGSGKGTQAARLAARSGFVHFDMGGTLRNEVDKGSHFAEEIKSYTNKGMLVPLHIIKKLFSSALADYLGKDVILDGFPRSMEQAELLDEVLDEQNRRLSGVFYFVLDDSVLIDRIVNRRYCPLCGRLYNILFKPPREDERCDDDAAKLDRRPDDSEDVLRVRLEVYRRETEPILGKYREDGLLSEIDARGTMEEIENSILMELCETK